MATHRDWLNEPVSALGLTPRTLRRVESRRLATIGELCDLTEDEFLAPWSFGFSVTMVALHERLAALGLRMRRPDEPPCYPSRPPEPPPPPPAEWDVSLTDLGFSIRTHVMLESEGFATAGDIAIRIADELAEIRGANAAFVAEVERRLAERGLRLGMRPPVRG